MTAKRAIGFVGLGAMGLPMAARLTAAGWSVIAFDQDPARLHQVEELGGVPVGSCAEVAAAADEFVITMVRDGVQTSELFDGPSGFRAPSVQRTYVVMSSIGRRAIRRLESRLGEDCVLLDAPVSGGVRGASDGTLEILIAGRPDVFRRAGAWLKHVGSRTTVVAGGIGAAQAAKTVTQVMQTLEMLALVESMELARTYGLSEQDALRVLSRLLSQAWAIDRWDDVKQALDGDARSISFELLRKDLQVALEDALAEGVPLPLTAAGLHDLLARVHPIAEVDESGGCRVT